MRFGLPVDYEVVIDNSTNHNQFNNNNNNTTTNNNNAIVKYVKTQPQTLLDIADSIKIKPRVDNKFRDIINSINKYSEQSKNQKLDEIKGKANDFNQAVENHSLIIRDIINEVANEFNNKLNLQHNEVQQIINEENERIRRAQELERKRQEEKQRKLEELRQKKLEEERKRVEEERKRKEEEDAKKKALEEEEKKAAAKRAEEEAQRIKAAKEAKEERERQERQKAKQAESLSSIIKIEKEFLKYKEDIAFIKKEIVNKLDENKDLKKNVNQVKRKINPKFGQLSNSRTQLERIKQEVIGFIKMTESIPLAHKWILNFIAKAIVDQAETEVIVKPTAALPLAHLARSLLQEFPEFEFYLNARFIKKCPYIIGYACSIDSEQGRIRMGWKRKDGKWEDEVKYDERVSGICTVWATMTRLEGYTSFPLYSFEASWIYLARSLNLKKELITNTQYSIAGNWWEASARQFLPKFGRQGIKIMELLVKDWPLSVSERKYPAAARLLIFGEDWLVNNRIEALKEMEP
ncbi:GLE1-like protein-domain-containing protein [Scheffersomyces amazonensis]|uniref:GLE1-like protein-domain-containing protein n=1 Tax=Scheffersomyces amazonensis TaxID=1078765 RepID=UPI00315CA676